MDTLDNILSGRGEDTPAPENAATEQAAPERTETTEQATETEQQEGQQETVKTVPHEALHAEKQKVKRYTEEVSSFRQENIALRQEIARLAQLVEQQNKPKEEPRDWFADPDAAFQQNFNASVRPVLDQNAQAVNVMQQTREFVSRRFAEQAYGKDAIKAAYDALSERLATSPDGRAIYQQIMSSGDPWDSLAQWHKRETFMAEAGADPDAYRAKLKAEVLAEMQQGNGQQQPAQQRPAPVMPSNLAGARNVGNRSGPVWSGPKTLNDIFNR